MRIVSGTHKGKRIQFPQGEQTRPTKDRIRESIFNILAHASWCDLDIDEAYALDGFAGSGSLGLEALSRGAIDCVFIDDDRDAINCCEENLQDMKISSKGHIFKEDILSIKYRPQDIEKRNLIMLDPPYSRGLGMSALKELVLRDWVEDDAIIILEMAKKSPEEIDENFTLLEERKYGITKVYFLKYNKEP